MKGGGGGSHKSVRGQSLRTLYKSYHFFSHEKCGSYNTPTVFMCSERRAIGFGVSCLLWLQTNAVVGF
jgi:predicted N-acyltransferase